MPLVLLANVVAMFVGLLTLSLWLGPKEDALAGWIWAVVGLTILAAILFFRAVNSMSRLGRTWRNFNAPSIDLVALAYPGGVVLMAAGLIAYYLGRRGAARLTPRRGTALLFIGLLVGGALIALGTWTAWVESTP